MAGSNRTLQGCTGNARSASWCIRPGRYDRRDFLKAAGASCLAMIAPSRSRGEAPAAATRPLPEAVAVTRGPMHHFFGYYDKTPWSQSGRHLLAMEIGFCDRQGKPGEPAPVGVIDLAADNKFTALDKTTAWCWQQGTMLQWLGGDADRAVIYNGFDDGHYVSIIRDVRSGHRRVLPRPVYAVSADGTQAVSLNFARLGRLRPGYGYAAIPDTTEKFAAPDDDGIHWMDMKTGESRLILSLAWAAGHKRDKRFDGAQHWFNHLLFNPSGSRFIFLHRWQRRNGGWFTRLYTAQPDGTDVRLLSDTGMVSHFDWRDDEHVLAWSRTAEHGDRFYLFNDRTGAAEVVGEGVLTRDGHCSYSPDRNWILVDTYPDKQNMQALMLYRVADGRRIDIGRFYQPPQNAGKPYRCDLHPRWNRDGRQVCIDSAHGPTRQMYVIDLRSIVGG